jgi:hypothetical protein
MPSNKRALNFGKGLDYIIAKKAHTPGKIEGNLVQFRTLADKIKIVVTLFSKTHL